jgi:hypothetical protein
MATKRKWEKNSKSNCQTVHRASGNYFCEQKRLTPIRIYVELHYIFNVCIVDVCQKFCYNTLYHTLSYLAHGFGSRTASIPVVIFGPAPSNIDTRLGQQVTTNCVRTPTTGLHLLLINITRAGSEVEQAQALSLEKTSDPKFHLPKHSGSNYSPTQYPS